jgi:hypothetical protein
MVFFVFLNGLHRIRVILSNKVATHNIHVLAGISMALKVLGCRESRCVDVIWAHGDACGVKSKVKKKFK